MKKFLLLIVIVGVLVGCWFVISYFQPISDKVDLISHSPSQSLPVQKNNEANTSLTSQQITTQKQNMDNVAVDAYPINQIDAKKLIQSIHNQSVVNYLSVNDSGLPPFEIDKLKQDYKNLREYGSYSGGKITHEFRLSDDVKVALWRNGGWEKILKNLNFVPTDMGQILGNDFVLKGGDYAGALHDNKFNSVFRYYENSKGARFEMNEMYLAPQNNYSLDVYEESINFYVSGYPATLETLKNAENKTIYNLDLNTNDRVFSITTEDVRYSELLQVAEHIVKVNQK
ncbi:hypothetical protein [Moraxella boevrei]|uniref:hypothetical protein n=1 Tax=Faucicola boevrei TaxID=346665 RepID=UPI003734F50E